MLQGGVTVWPQVFPLNFLKAKGFAEVWLDLEMLLRHVRSKKA